MTDFNLWAHIDQFPHCDQRVLHAPGECDYCDGHPEWQALRIAWGISFTGHNDGDLVCPATVRRDVEIINRWGGNVAHRTLFRDQVPDKGRFD